MMAKNKIGDTFKHITGENIEAVEIDGVKYFTNDYGDLFSYIGDDYTIKKKECFKEGLQCIYVTNVYV